MFPFSPFLDCTITNANPLKTLRLFEPNAVKSDGSPLSVAMISPGPSIPPYESLIKFIPKDSLFNTSSDWLYHTGTMTFGNIHIFDSALNERYGTASSMKEYVAKAQAHNYEGHRAMLEAYGLHKYNTATGVVQWMLSNAWPGLIWHTYDYYLYPAGTYYGMKKSMEPLHVMYSYQSNSINIINSLLKKFNRLQVKADVYNVDGSLKYSHSVTTNVAEDSVQKCFALPEINVLSATYFLRLQLKDEKGVTKSINWYWLSKKKDELAWKKSKWYYTPQSAFADFSALQNLPETKLNVVYTTTKSKDSTTHTITVSNGGKAVAFFVHLRALKNKNADDILPVIFDDNYLLLAPGESRKILCSYGNADAGGNADPYILTSAWNLDLSKSTSSKGSGFEEEEKSKDK